MRMGIIITNAISTFSPADKEEIPGEESTSTSTTSSLLVRLSPKLSVCDAKHEIVESPSWPVYLNWLLMLQIQSVLQSMWDSSRISPLLKLECPLIFHLNKLCPFPGKYTGFEVEQVSSADSSGLTETDWRLMLACAPLKVATSIVRLLDISMPPTLEIRAHSHFPSCFSDSVIYVHFSNTLDGNGILGRKLICML